jgi:hypothetical protein
MGTLSKGSFWKLASYALMSLVSNRPAWAYDMYNVTKSSFDVPISGLFSADVFLGEGLNMDDPLMPVTVPHSPFQPNDVKAMMAQSAGTIDRNTILGSVTSFVEDTSDYEFSQAIYANMHATFQFASLNSALSIHKNRH